jgi:hypothetical protein
MKYDQLIQLYFERSSALQWYWTLYVIVIGGLLAFSTLRVRRDLLTVCLVTVLYSFFAVKNLGAIHDVTLQRAATLTAIRLYDANDTSDLAQLKQVRSLLEPTLVAPDYGGIRLFHLASDGLTLLVFWAMDLRRVRYAKEEAHHPAV